MNTTLLSKEEAYERIYAQGDTVKTWAEKHGFDYQRVLDVATGRNKGNRGIGREIAIKLGMKRQAKPLDEI